MKRLDIRQIEATGTRDATTALHGDGVWRTPGGGAGGGSAAAGASIYYASATAQPSATGIRDVKFDTTHRADAGFVVNLTRGSITVPADGWYSIHVHVRLAATVSTNYIAGASDIIGSSSPTLIRGTGPTGSLSDISADGTVYLVANTEVFANFYSQSATQIAGGANRSLTTLRVVRL